MLDSALLSAISVALSDFDYFSIPPDTGEVRSVRARVTAVLAAISDAGYDVVKRPIGPDGDTR